MKSTPHDSPGRSGITRTGSGLAIISIGITVLFGDPREPLDEFAGWFAVGVVLLAFGALLLGFGMRAIRYSQLKEQRLAMLARRARRAALLATIEAAHVEEAKLEHWLMTARAYDDKIRSMEIEAHLVSLRNSALIARAELDELG